MISNREMHREPERLIHRRNSEGERTSVCDLLKGNYLEVPESVCGSITTFNEEEV